MADLDPTIRAFLVGLGRVGTRTVVRFVEGLLEEAEEVRGELSAEAQKRINRARERARSMRKRQDDE
jgi:hypothetical protein